MTDIIFWRLPNPSMNPTLSTDDPKEKLNDLMPPFPLPKVLLPCPKIDLWRLAYLLREVIQYININTSEQSKINNAINTPPSSFRGRPVSSFGEKRKWMSWNYILPSSCKSYFDVVLPNSITIITRQIFNWVLSVYLFHALSSGSSKPSYYLHFL